MLGVRASRARLASTKEDKVTDVCSRFRAHCTRDAYASSKEKRGRLNKSTASLSPLVRSRASVGLFAKRLAGC